MGLRSGDRLEPSPSLPDVGQVFTLSSAELPLHVVFWRQSENTLVLHRNPLWDEELGITPSRSLTVDVLHTLHLGIFQQWGKLAVWSLLDATVWVSPGGSAEERHKVQVLCLRNDLDNFYRERHRARPNENLTRVHDLTVKMFGTKSDPALKLSGAETWGFLLYLNHALDFYSHKLPAIAKTLLAAGRCLEKLYTTMQEASTTPSVAALQVSTRETNRPCKR